MSQAYPVSPALPVAIRRFSNAAINRAGLGILLAYVAQSPIAAVAELFLGTAAKQSTNHGQNKNHAHGFTSGFCPACLAMAAISILLNNMV